MPYISKSIIMLTVENVYRLSLLDVRLLLQCSLMDSCSLVEHIEESNSYNHIQLYFHRFFCMVRSYVVFVYAMCNPFRIF